MTTTTCKHERNGEACQYACDVYGRDILVETEAIVLDLDLDV